MKTAKKVLALTLSLALILLVFAGCHKKNETAVTIGDYTFTSGYYACALVFADIDARQKVYEQFESEGKDTTDIDYLSQKIDGKSYDKWVKEKAIDILKENAGYMALCKENDFELTEENRTTAESHVDSYWSYLGYDELFQNNGVSKETYLKFTIDSYYAQIYFDNVYGKEGTNPVTEEQLKAAIAENFVLIDRITVDTSELDDEEAAAKKTQLEGYLEKLNSGTTFAEIFAEYDAAEGNEVRDTTAGDGVESAIDPNAEMVGDADSNYPCDYYDELVAMKTGESKIIENGTEIVLVQKLDISADAYYLTQYDDTLRTIVVGDEADEAARKKADELGVNQVKKAVDLFKVKNIKYPEE